MSIRYRATKINTAVDPSFESASSIEEYRDSLSDKYGFSPPVDYYVEGEVVFMPKVGCSFRMLRNNRNGVEVMGFFKTSEITSIKEQDGYSFFTTQNSIYKLEKLP